MFGYANVDGGKEVDLEAGGSSTLYPGLGESENELRWGFIRKVYAILTAQIVLTTIVSAVTVLYTPITRTLEGSTALAIGLAIIPFIWAMTHTCHSVSPPHDGRGSVLLIPSVLCPLYHYQQSHPLNLVLLGLFTVSLSLPVGVACANTQGKIVLEALMLTSAVVLSLTGYTFWASKRGKDFSFLGPILFAALIILLVMGVIQIFFPLGSTSVAIFSGIGALIFAGYLVYDTDNLIKRFSYDEYVWASVILYLDILNLFLFLLNMLKGIQSDG